MNTAAESLRDLDLDLQLFYDYVRGEPAQTAFTKELDKTIARMKQEKAKMFLSYGDSPEKVAICTNLPLDVVQSLIR